MKRQPIKSEEYTYIKMGGKCIVLLLGNLDEMDQFLERLKLSKLTLEEIDNMSSTKFVATRLYFQRSFPQFITKFAAKTFLKKKMSGIDGFAGELQQTFKEELMPVLKNVSQKI